MTRITIRAVTLAAALAVGGCSFVSENLFPSFGGDDPEADSEFVPLLENPPTADKNYPYASNLFHGRVRVRQTFQTDPENNLDASITRFGSSGSLERLWGTLWSVPKQQKLDEAKAALQTLASLAVQIIDHQPDLTKRRAERAQVTRKATVQEEVVKTCLRTKEFALFRDP